MSTFVVILFALIGLAALEPTERQIARAERAPARRGDAGRPRTPIRELGLLRG